MALLETLTLQLAPAIAKSILKLWLKDAGIALDVSSSLVDLLKGKTVDIITQQKAKRQFEAIGEQVAQNLAPVFESAGIDENGQSAVALAIADTLNTAKIDSALLIERNLEPTELAKYLLGNRPGTTNLFSEPEESLYRRIISETSRLIVDIASQLPTFTERTFAEVLKREDSLLAITDRILEEVRHIRASSQSTEQAVSQFEADYRQEVVRNLDKLELFGVDATSASSRHKLTVAYIALSVQRETDSSKKQSDNDNSISANEPRLASVTESSSSVQMPDESDAESESVNKVLADSERLFVRGEAGSGKTTLLQWIAVHSARNDFPDDLTGWNRTIPFFISLRQCVETKLPVPESFVRFLTPTISLPAPENFVRFVAPMIADTMPNGWVHSQLKSGRAIVMIDGVDEIPEASRKEFYGWLENLVQAFPHARYIVTSRPYAVAEKNLENLSLGQAELQEMDSAAIDEFIDHWHSAVREELRDPEERAELQKLASRLKYTMRENRSIRSLATNPLLCAMLCALHRDRRQQLPSDRIELYEAGIHMLLERRDTERRVALSDFPALNYRQKKSLLQDIAYWMLKNGLSEVPSDRVKERLGRLVREIREMREFQSERFVDGTYRFFVQRSGIVREPVSDSFDFTHRTFQEFLAAKAALDEDDSEFLVGSAKDDRWHEVIILAAGLAGNKVRNSIVEKLIKLGDEDSAHRESLHLLAVACLETAVGLLPEVRAQVDKRMRGLIPPRNMTQARALSSARDLVVPYLSWQKTRGRYEGRVTAACVRTLALVGSNDALDALRGYSNDGRRAVTNELIRAWDVFDRQEYAEKVLNSYTTLDIDRVSVLDGFEYLDRLTSLRIRNALSVNDVSPISHLSRLARLWMIQCPKLSDLTPLGKLTGLTDLSLLWCGPLGDITPLANLANLTKLNLASREITANDLSPLSQLKKLDTLNLGAIFRVNDLGPLKELRKLRRLLLNECQEIARLDALVDLTDLEYLQLTNCKRIQVLENLGGLSKLRRLVLSDLVQQIDVSPLIKLQSLEELVITNCPKLDSLNRLGDLIKLRHLSLNGCKQLGDLSWITNLKQVTQLDLGDTDMVEFTFLQRLPNLRVLSVPRAIDLDEIKKQLPSHIRLRTQGWIRQSLLFN
ncbi:MAG: NACHT domain-containing protein [Chloroflexi bacterium]|nr:NACHT domain-containing protein [Chloroflexota bacterium]